MHLLFSCISRGMMWCTLIIVTSLHAQSPSSGSIAGTVLNRATSAPIRRAIVTLSTMETQPQDAVAWTDAAGRFSFSFLPPGRYRLYAAKDGFQGAGYGAEARNRPPDIISLAAGENRTGVNFRLPPFSSISGIILDEAGDPLPGAQIQIMTPGLQRRKRTLIQGPGTATDMEGRYRIPNVMPGKYIVMAQMQQPVIKGQAEVSAGQMQEPRMYGAQYFPGTGSAEAATSISVEPGREVEQINFRLPPEGPAATLQGRVAIAPGLSTTNHIQIMIVGSGFGQRFMTSTGAAPPDFAFTMGNLRQDKYLVIARTSSEGKQYSGSQEVDLRGQSAPSVTLTLELGIDLSGKVTVEGPDAAKYSAEYVSLNAGDPLAQYSGRSLRASVKKDGTFTIRSVLPGVWDIDAGPIPPGGYLKSMHLGTQDVLTEEMVITAKTTAPLNIVVSTQAAAVEGDVTKGKGESVKSAVLLAPEGKFRDVTSFYRVAASDEKGHYEMKGLTPGKYRLYTMEEFDPAYIQDSEMLKPLERFSVPIELKEGATTRQNLTLTPRTGANP